MSLAGLGLPGREEALAEAGQSASGATRSADAALPGRPRRLASASIRTRLYAVFVLSLALVLGLGSFGVARMTAIDRASAVIRDHWLRDLGLLGDLANYMSDYRAAEADYLLASTAEQRAAGVAELARLHATVAASQEAYESIVQAPSESALYREFARDWAQYQVVAGQVTALAAAGRSAEANALYHADSRRIFERSSDVLASLTDETVRNARRDSERAAATYARARGMIVAAMALAALLLFGVIGYVTRGILLPLLALAGRMRDLAEHDTSILIPGTDRQDEIGEMARAVAVFRSNAVSLVTSQRRSIEQAAALEEGLEHERRLTAQQRDFVSMTSHEFRTPLTVIDGHAQRLIKTSERLDAADVAERGRRIRSAVQRITSIMDSLLGASRVLDGHAVFHPEPIDPRVVLADAAQAHRDATPGALIQERWGELPASMRGDARLLFHAFSNLISNAVKYSSPGSPVELSADTEPGWLVVQVRDRGVGIPARDREHLFERYFRGSNATGVAGTGVGLHLVALVVKLHDGEVRVESKEGVGSRFIVRLPLAPPAAPATITS